MFRFASWNINGFRAISVKDAWRNWFSATNADIIGLQETKAAPEQIDPAWLQPAGWQTYWAASVVKKGYSGVAVFVRSELVPISVHVELPYPQFQGEGRLLHLEFPKFHYVNVYFPNGTQNSARLDYKMGFYDAFLEYAEKLRSAKPIVLCGDLNTAHRPLDLVNPDKNSERSGFLPQERAWIDKFIAAGYVDTFRVVHGDVPDCYTWWSYKQRTRKYNNGWRIDYFFISRELLPALRDAWIEKEVLGSDHCPIGIVLDTE